MLSAPFARIFSLITFNFNHYALIRNHVLFFNTLPWCFKLFLREKIIIPDLCEDMMNYFHEGSFRKTTKCSYLKQGNNQFIWKKKWPMPTQTQMNLSYGSNFGWLISICFLFHFHASMHFQLDWLWKEQYITRNFVLIFPIWFQPLWERLG